MISLSYVLRISKCLNFIKQVCRLLNEGRCRLPSNLELSGSTGYIPDLHTGGYLQVKDEFRMVFFYPPPPLSDFYVLFVRKFGVFFDTPLCVDAIYDDDALFSLCVL